ncbi:AP-5 complex subunit zeta-1 [Protopterus annectens]|uniref:AP-5 complex subunit zeta-1 n=1 Tax=Protopterus annectens TaxID=7888 RepID=UPI001CF9800E|nr:AP-5 complex subunit zeta-1 [Protopterus annectens]
MSVAGAESRIKQARKIQDEELLKFCAQISNLLNNQDYGTETLDSLQKLYLIIAVTKYSRKLTKEGIEKLESTLCWPKTTEQIQTLCAAILREISPCDHLTLSVSDCLDTKVLSLVFSVLLAQGNRKDEVHSVGQRVVKLLESRLPEGQSLRYLFPVLSKVIKLSPAILNEDQVNMINKKFVDWLRYASVQQGVLVSSGGFFSGSRTRQPGPINEVDGAVAADFFTVLSIGNYYTEDQWMNVHVFSMLRKWLLCYGSDVITGDDADIKSESEGSVMSMVSAASTSSRLLPPKERLREKALEYCLRLIEQSDRKAVKKLDSDLQKACLIEAVYLMDIICQQDSSFVYRAFSCLKALYSRICGDFAFARVILPIAQFFLRHSEMAAVESEAVYRHLFTKLPPELFHDSMFAFEFVQFCRENEKLLGETVSNFRQNFPNLLKFLAWHSPALIAEFVELLPALIVPETAIEMLHSLLDLPCMTAVLDVQLRSQSTPFNEKAPVDHNLKPSSSLEAFRHPYYRSMFLYILRGESGAGDTIDRLNLLHEVLLDMVNHSRILQCAQTVPILLQVYFNVVSEFADGTLINQLVLVLLERSSLLFNIKAFKTEVHRVFSSQLLVLCKLHPFVIVEQSKELLEFCGTVTNIQSKENFFTHIVWAIGEYLSVAYNDKCTVEIITRFFEALEALLFEITQLRPSASVPRHHPRVITVLMTTLSKLASRSQDLIPRVSLFLSKIRPFARSSAVASTYAEEDIEELLSRASELMNLLNLPSIAQFVLAPSAEHANPRYHRDTNVSLPLAMRTMTKLLQRGTNSVPG